MSASMDEEIRRRTARRKSAPGIEIIQGETTVSEARRRFDLPPSQVETWVDDAKKGMKNALRANPTEVRRQCERPLRDLPEACGEAMPELRAKKTADPRGAGRADARRRFERAGEREMIPQLHEGLAAEGPLFRRRGSAPGWGRRGGGSAADRPKRRRKSIPHSPNRSRR